MTSLISKYDHLREKSSQNNTFFNIRLDLLVCLLLAFSILAVYWQIRNHDFINLDDDVYVTDNNYVKAGINLDSIIWAFSLENKDNTYWHPVTWFSHMLDCQLYGMNPGMHHSVNLLFHIANTILLFLVFRRMTGDFWKSALVAAFFGLHPLNVETVAWVSERKNVLSTFFWILTMTAYVRYTERTGVYRYLPVFFLLMLGQMVKPMLVTLPFVLLLLDYWPLGRFKIGQWRTFFHLIREKIPLFSLSVLSVGIAVLSNQHLGILQSTETVPITLRIENALVSYVEYIVKTIWPNNMAVYYPFPDSLPLWQVAGALLVLACISFALLLKLKHIPSLGTGWLWYLGTSVPIAGLVQNGLWPAMADRWAYVPEIGIFIIIVWGGSRLLAKYRCRKWIPVTASMAFLAILMITTWLQAQYWADSISLFRHALDITKGSYMVHNNLGNALARQGKLDEAIEHYSEALRISPSKAAEVHNNLGAAMIVKGRFREAIPHLRYALQKMPEHASARKNLQQALQAIEKRDTSGDQEQ